MRGVFLGVALGLLVSACGSGAQPAHPVEAPKSAKAASAPKSEELSEADKQSAALVAEMLERVARARGLPIKRRVPGKILDRETMGNRIRESALKDTPKEVFVGQGEFLASLELVPADYDFMAGAFALLGGRVAGFYDPDDGHMYLADDLGEDEATETLAHELAHALADQSFPLKPMIEYAPGAGDRLSAVHAVVEGDATSAMLDVTLGSAFEMTEETVRLAFIASTMMSDVGAKTPRAISASLVCSYTDGFAFVQAVRRSGDWRAMDEVWRAMPETTEQLLHIEKYKKREPAEKIDVPALGALGKDGYKAILDDVIGEQGLRIALEDFAPRSVAREGAAGWGGDRFVVAERVVGEKHRYAVALRLRMDTVEDAAEVEAIFGRKYGKACREREKLGPLAWERRGRDIALVSGPYEREGGQSRSAGGCAEANGWLRDIFQAAPPEGS